MTPQPRPRRKLIGEAWLKYSHGILDPIRADRIQRQETKRAFYAGASSLLESVMRNLAPGDEPTEPDLTMMVDIQKELDDFVRSVTAGRA